MCLYICSRLLYLKFGFTPFAELLEPLLDDVGDDVGVLAVDVLSSLVLLHRRGVREEVARQCRFESYKKVCTSV